MSFHVFVEGAVEGTPDGIRKLSEAIAVRYGLRAPDLIGRLSKGRVRVKGNVDRAAAEQLARELTAIGARCTIEDASAPARPSAPSYQSGLAAAFSSQAPAASLGALDSGAMSLVGVDGADEAVAPPAPAVTPPAAPAPPPKRKAVAEPPIDMFAPPGGENGGELKLEIAADDVERSARKRASTPPAAAPIVEPAPVRRSQPAIAPVTPGDPLPDDLPPASKLGPLASRRVRLAVGVAIAIAIGFVPAHVVASSRERAAYAQIDRQLEAAQQAADTPDAYDGLDKVRATHLARKTDARRNIALLALAIWAAVGAGIGFLWFRKVPWDRL